MLHKVSKGYSMQEKRPYEELKFYQDICEIRKLIHGLTEGFEKLHLRLVSQMRDAARSAKQNIREGYRKGTLGEFLHSIRISQGSLEELSGDMEDCLEDKLITEQQFNEFKALYQSASYLSTQYVKAMNRQTNIKSWRIPMKKVTLSNFKQPKMQP